MSISGLKKHIQAVKKKAAKEFKQEPKKTKSHSTKIYYETDLLYDGCLRKSLMKIVHPLYDINPVTGEKTLIEPPKKKKLKSLTKNEKILIKNAIRAICWEKKLYELEIPGMSWVEAMRVRRGYFKE